MRYSSHIKKLALTMVIKEACLHQITYMGTEAHVTFGMQKLGSNAVVVDYCTGREKQALGDN